MIQAVIYDLDDLMVNSYPLHAEGWRIIMRKYGFSAQIGEEFIGMRVCEVAEALAKRFNLSVDAHGLFLAHQKLFLQLVREQLCPMPGLRESLQLCKARGYRAAIASSGTRAYIDLVLQKFGIKEYFELIVSGDDVAKGKPDPEVYLMAAARLGLDPAECVVLEDATAGIAAAKAAGCACVAVRNPHTPRQDLSQADMIIDSLNDLEQALPEQET